MPVATKKQKKADAAPPAELAYPQVEVREYHGRGGAGLGPLTGAKAREYLGWEAETDAVKFGDDYLLRDEYGAKVRCLNNTRNRPLAEAWARTLAQDILRGHWRLNGETVVIGQTGQVLSAQHRMIGLVLAEQMWDRDPHWKKAGPWKDGPPTIEIIAVLGVDESGDTTKTLDNVKPRTLEDVLYTDVDLFGKLPPKDRRAMAGVLAYAVKLLWHRAGRDVDAYAPRRTHSESVEFITRHPKLVEMCRHVFEENQNAPPPYSASASVSPGTMAGLAYLMAASQSDGDKYRAGNPPSEKRLDMTMLEKAQEFVSLFGSGAAELAAVRQAIAALHGESGERTPRREEREAVFVNAWNLWSTGVKPTPKKIEPEWEEVEATDDEPAYKRMTAMPTVGGMDLGDPEEPDDVVEDAADEQPAADAPKITDKAKATADALARLRERHPGVILFFRGKGDEYKAWGADAKVLGKVSGVPPAKDATTKLLMSSFDAGLLEERAEALIKAGYRVAVVTQDGKGEKVQEVKLDDAPAADTPAETPAEPAETQG